MERVLLVCEVALQSIYQHRDSIPSHLAAFCMKIKIYVFDPAHSKFTDNFFEGKFDGFLVTGVID